MNSKFINTVRFLGVLGLVLIGFGLLSWFIVVVEASDFNISLMHFVLGGLCLVFFALGGGLRTPGRSMRRALGLGGSIFAYTSLFLVLLSLANYLSFRYEPFRYDSTAEKVFTLAPQSLKVLSELPEKVTARAFYVGKIDAEARGVLDLFAQSSPKFSWQWVDPEKSPGQMDLYGVSQSGTIHFSFAEGKDGREAKIVKTINEQEIVNALLKLSRNKERVVYYTSGHGEPGLEASGDRGFLFLREAIQGENIAVRPWKFAEQSTLPDDASALLVMAPEKSLLPAELESLKSYLKKGGGALFFAEPKAREVVADLVRPLGIEVGNDLVVDKVMFPVDTLSDSLMVTNYGQHKITERLNQGTVFNGACSVVASSNFPSSAKLTQLAYSGANSWAERDLEKLYSDKPVAARDPGDYFGPVPLVVAYEGPYPEGSFRREGEGLANGSKKEPEQNKSRILVFGDQDFVANANIRQLFNADFFLNSLNWAMGEEAGITVRARNLKASLKKLSDEDARAIYIFAGILFPELLLLSGLSLWWFRRKL